MKENNAVYQIYDSIFKRIFNLSNLSIINLINGLFDTNHPQGAEVVYLNKESVNHFLERHYADVFVRIEGVTYHLEAQIQKDGNMVLRVFEYGFYHGMETRENPHVIKFPEAIVIYLDDRKKQKAESVLTLDFGSQGTFDYKVKNYYYQEHELKELNQKKLVVLIPFQLIKLKKLINKKKSKENLDSLRNLIYNDILGSVETNLKSGNITEDDGDQLLELIYKLYSYILEHYEELGGSEDMRELLPGAMELPLDKYRKRIDELTQEKEEISKQNQEVQKQMENLAKKDKLTEILLMQNRMDELVRSRTDEELYQELLHEFGLSYD